MAEQGNFRVVQQSAIEDARRWFGDEVSRNLTIAIAGMNGEAGEAIDLLKKVMRGSLELESIDTIEKLRNEVTDTFIYVIEAAELLDFDVLDRYLNHHRPLNELRFGGSNGSQS